MSRNEKSGPSLFVPGVIARGLMTFAAAAIIIAVALTAPQKNGIYMDQMTFLLQAISVAEDFDFVYDEHDRERFLKLGWGPEPRGLFLREHEGKHYFAKPILYAVLAAPFVKIAPNRGALILNTFLWILVVELTFRALRRVTAEFAAAVLSTAAWSLCAVPFYVFVIHADLLIIALLALFLYVSIYTLPSAKRYRLDVAVALGIVGGCMVYEKLPHLFFFGAMLLLIRKRDGWAGAFAVFAGFVMPILVLSGLHYAENRTLSPYQGNRRVSAEVDPFSEMKEKRQEPSAMGTGAFFERSFASRILSVDRVARVISHTPRFILNTLCGRKVGLFPYLTPFLFLGAWGVVSAFTGRGRTAAWLLIPALIYVIFYWIILPTNYHGGPTTLGNRYLMQIAPAIALAAAQLPIAAAAVYAGVGFFIVMSVYFPGRLIRTPATAVRDNYLVFQWNRFKNLPLEPELLRGCDRYDCRFVVDQNTEVFRLSEPNPDAPHPRFWIGAGADTRLAVLRRGAGARPFEVRLASASYEVEGVMVSGSRATPFLIGPNQTFPLVPQLSRPIHNGLRNIPESIHELRIRVTRAVETAPLEKVVPEAALHLTLSQPTDESPVHPKNARIVFEPGDARNASLLLWGWWDIPDGAAKADRWGGSLPESAVAVPYPQNCEIAFEGDEGRQSFPPAQTVQFTLKQHADAANAVEMSSTAATSQTAILRIRHSAMSSPASVTKNAYDDTRMLTGMYNRLNFRVDCASTAPAEAQ